MFSGQAVHQRAISSVPSLSFCLFLHLLFFDLFYPSTIADMLVSVSIFSNPSLIMVLPGSWHL